jgi:hypothetical protein
MRGRGSPPQPPRLLHDTAFLIIFGRAIHEFQRHGEAGEMEDDDPHHQNGAPMKFHDSPKSFRKS